MNVQHDVLVSCRGDFAEAVVFKQHVERQKNGTDTLFFDAGGCKGEGEDNHFLIWRDHRDFIKLVVDYDIGPIPLELSGHLRPPK